MVINGTILEWGNSMGIRLKKSDLAALHLQPRQAVQVQITKIDNPLRELWGLAKREKASISRSEFKRMRRELEGDLDKW